MTQELSPKQLRRTCDPEQFSFETTAELPITSEIIGQPRATRSIRFGLDIAGNSYNIVVLGHEGTGRTTTIHRFLSQRAAQKSPPDDWIYVYNFHQPRHPRAISLPPGIGAQFQEDMATLITELRQAVPQAFDTDAYHESCHQIDQAFQADQEELLDRMGEQAREQDFTLTRTPSGLALTPLKNGKPIPPEVFHKLPIEEQERLTATHQDLEKDLEKTLRQLRKREREARTSLRELDREVAAYTVGHAVDEIKDCYADYEEIGEYLEEVRTDIVAQVETFKADHQKASEGDQSPPDPFHRYLVNLLVDNRQQEGAPVVVEPNPTYRNLVGQIEYELISGTPVTNFTLLKAGALHRANGGYLVLQARDVLANPLAWQALKRTLMDREIRMEEREQPPFSVVSLDPEPIPLEVKVILIGSRSLYYYLYGSDESFRKLFKVKADFSTEMERTPENELLYASFIRARCEEEGLRPFDRAGVARMVEYGSRMAEDQSQLSVRFGEIADLLREADHWAKEAEREIVTAEDVKRTIDERIYRANRVEEEVRRVITEGTLLIETEGEAVGQVNGLALSAVAGYIFGRPTRITACAYVGRGGVVDIHREVKLSAPSHGKGVLTLVSYLGRQYATDRPLTLSASLSFEQTYDEVHGDSASLTELCALLSSLSDLPVRQGIAVTGSVDQRGRVQPVGGVTAKIEGFFRICQEQALTSEQGVIIPSANRRNLMLHEEVVEAVREGQFHIYPVATVDEAIERLTGVPAGERDEENEFPEDTVHGRVQSRLEELAEGMDKGRAKKKGAAEEEDEGEKASAAQKGE